MTLGPKTKIMGILNITPDSFYAESRFPGTEEAVSRGIQLVEEGADMLDIGGESTRPGSKPVSIDEEISRVLPVIRGLAQKTNIPLSVDTVKSSVARLAAEAGAAVLNDVSGLRFDPDLALVAAEYGTALILGHLRGLPPSLCLYPPSADIMMEVNRGLRDSIELSLHHGVRPDQIILDPGIGFGKDALENLIILNRLEEIGRLGFPVMVGVSRKRFIGRIAGLAEPADRLPGSIAAGVAAIFHGAAILRVHDVAATCQAARITDAILEATTKSSTPASL